MAREWAGNDLREEERDSEGNELDDEEGDLLMAGDEQHPFPSDDYIALAESLTQLHVANYAPARLTDAVAAAGADPGPAVGRLGTAVRRAAGRAGTLCAPLCHMRWRPCHSPAQTSARPPLPHGSGLALTAPNLRRTPCRRDLPRAAHPQVRRRVVHGHMLPALLLRRSLHLALAAGCAPGCFYGSA